MRSNVPEKLLKVMEDIDAKGDVPLTRLTVLKKWFEWQGRLPAFAIWVAGRATAHQGKTKGEAAVLFGEARKLLAGVDRLRPDLDRMTAKAIHDRMKKVSE